MKKHFGYWDSLALHHANPIEMAPISTYKRLNAKQMGLLKNVPPKTSILTREFIHNSLYHPFYGYFSKRADVFTLSAPIDFRSVRNNSHFMGLLSQSYYEIEEKQAKKTDIAQQVWHTPTELFRPHYGNALAAYLIKTFKNNPQDEFIIYEIGAGNGTLMSNIMDYIQKNENDIYKVLSYKIIEISPQLATIQEGQRKMNPLHGDRIEIINKSILDWKEIEERQCFFIAMEVLDNLSHDLIRYDSESGVALQGITLIDEKTNYEEGYEEITDNLIQRYLDCRAKTGYTNKLLKSELTRSISNYLPFQSDMSKPEFIPTSCFSVLEKLNSCFPKHNLLISDFSSLPDAIEGLDAPVVQTRYHEQMIAVSTYLVQPGWFDIFFPTNFELLKDVYRVSCGRDAKIYTHQEFMVENSDLVATTTKSGENPMKSYYQNAKFIVS